MEEETVAMGSEYSNELFLHIYIYYVPSSWIQDDTSHHAGGSYDYNNIMTHEEDGSVGDNYKVLFCFASVTSLRRILPNHLYLESTRMGHSEPTTAL